MIKGKEREERIDTGEVRTGEGEDRSFKERSGEVIRQYGAGR